MTYVTDGIASAMAQAKAAAGDRNVLVHGAYTAQRALEAGVLDELQIHQIPVLFGGGRRLFEVLPSRIELEIVRVIDTPEATHIRYRVRRPRPGLLDTIDRLLFVLFAGAVMSYALMELTVYGRQEASKLPLATSVSVAGVTPHRP